MSDPKNVLLVDDSEDNRTLMSIFLRKLGFKVTTAEDGSAALALVRLQPFDVVLMDFEMPDMNGAETLAEMRSSGYLGRVVAMTGHNYDEARLGTFDGYLMKPISRVALERVINGAN